MDGQKQRTANKMKTIKNIIIGSLLFIGLNSYAQTLPEKSDFEQITETLMDYIGHAGKVFITPPNLPQLFDNRF